MTGRALMRGKVLQFQDPLYSFGVVSDIHINRTNQDAQGDLRKAFSAFRNRGITRVFCCGDISTNHTEDELELFKAVKDQYPEITFRSCTGNHDVQFTDAQWLQYVGHGFSGGGSIRAYVKNVNRDVFVFLPLAKWEDARPYSYGDDDWADGLEQLLGLWSGKRVFLFMHYPINSESASFQYPGLKVGQHYGFGQNSPDNEAIAQKIEWACSQAGVRSVTVFSGHSHYEFGVQGVEAGFEDTIFLQDGAVGHVHVPSLVVPRDKDMNVIHSGHPDQQPTQGYVVDVYPDHIKLMGLEFNLKPFETDQRKGIVRVGNVYGLPFGGVGLGEPLKFTAQDAGASVTFAKVGSPEEAQIVYSTDGTAWSDYSFGQEVALANRGDFVMFRAKDGATNRMSNSSNNCY